MIKDARLTDTCTECLANCIVEYETGRAICLKVFRSRVDYGIGKTADPPYERQGAVAQSIKLCQTTGLKA